MLVTLGGLKSSQTDSMGPCICLIWQSKCGKNKKEEKGAKLTGLLKFSVTYYCANMASICSI